MKIDDLLSENDYEIEHASWTQAFFRMLVFAVIVAIPWAFIFGAVVLVFD